jgi:hypothetical protein
VGAFDVDTFLPRKSGSSSRWPSTTSSLPLGCGVDEGSRSMSAVVVPAGQAAHFDSLSALDDTQRMFIVTLVLNELLAWMRSQSGTSSLRAIFYMDEIFGYFPPTASPPSKPPMLTLLKQGRAFGLGCVLATQNPVDLDYKGLSNAGTWLIGRLQTERDKMRVIEGLESALAGAGTYDRATLDTMMSGLTQRVFLMRNAHDDAPVLFQSRWALSYLRGPMTGPEIARLMGPRKAAAAASATHSAVGPGTSREASADGNAAMRAGTASKGTAAAAPSSAPENATSSVTQLPSALSPSATSARHVAGATEYFLPATRGIGPITYKPMIVGFAKLHFIDARLGLDQWRMNAYLAPLADDGNDVLWTEATVSADLKSRLATTPARDTSFAPLPGAAMRAGSYAAWGKTLSSYLDESARADELTCDALTATSAPGKPKASSARAWPSRPAAPRHRGRGPAQKYAPMLQTPGRPRTPR